MGIFQQFPYSNFHELNLDQIIKIMREMQDEWANTKAEWASYKDFIDNYFANLDVSDEVLNALRVMAADGTLNQVVDPTIARETAAWLADNITQPTTPVVDTSLTVSGAAADAEVTGDLIRNINIALRADSFYQSPFKDYVTQAGYYDDTGTYFPSGSWTCYELNATNSKIFRISAFAYGTGCSNYLVLDASNNVIARGNHGTTTPTQWGGFIFVATDGVKLIINTRANTAFSAYDFSNTYQKNGKYSSGSLNNATKFGSYNIDTTDVTLGNVTDVPDINGGTLFNIPGFGGGVNHITQMYFSATSKVFFRFVLDTDTPFTDWIRFDTSWPSAYISNKYFAFGDSICRGNHADSTQSPYDWPGIFGKIHGLIAYNMAIGGQGYKTTAYGVPALTTIQATDITDAALITLAFGINDASDNTVVIGTVDDTTNATMLGCVYQCIDYIYSQNPQVQLVICGTTKQNGTWSTRLADVNAGLKGIAAKYNIPFIDMECSPINQFTGTIAAGLTTDGTHFTDDGYKLLGQFMCGQLGKFFGY